MSFLSWLIPWEFSPTVTIVIAVTALLYLRGSLRHSPGFWRQLGFWTGLVLIYAMLLTHFDYYAEREFFLHRLQHLGLHHMGPFLIILSSPGQILRAGMPRGVRVHVWNRIVGSAPVRFVLDVLLHPVVASLLFFGIILFWLYPPVHFVAMLDWRLYRLMNWSVTVDGLLFWWLVLDHRPHPPARLAPGWRVLMPLFVSLPQIVTGAYITFTHTELYPIYDLCGRALSNISSMQSQQLGGLILWVPSGMMMALGAVLAFRHWLLLSSRGRLPPRGRQATPRGVVPRADLVHKQAG